MGSPYTHTVSIGEGDSIAASSQFQQLGTLSTLKLGDVSSLIPGGSISATQLIMDGTMNMVGPAAVTTSGACYLNGTVNATNRNYPWLPATITSTGGVWMSNNTGSTINTFKSDEVANEHSLDITGNVDDAGTINLFDAAGVGGGVYLDSAGKMSITGTMTAWSSAHINMPNASHLWFYSGGTGSIFDVAGTIDMIGATITTNLTLKLDSGTLLVDHDAYAANSTIDGNVLTANSATINFVTGAFESLYITGNYTQGATNLDILHMKIGSSSSDWLHVGGVADLAGNVTVDAVDALPASASWELITATPGGITGDFGYKHLPAGRTSTTTGSAFTVS